MAIVTFSKPVSFPIAPLRDMLAKYVPLFRWQCGEDDTGAPQQMGTYSEHGIISGRSDGNVIFTEYRARLARFPDAPAHEWYLELFQPTTELKPIADRIIAVICAIVMIADEDCARCQLVPGGPWLPAGVMPGVLRALTNGATLLDALAAAGPGAAIAGPAATQRTTQAPRIDAHKPGAHKLGMPMLMLLADRLLQPDWTSLENFARHLDPDGDWVLIGGGRDGLAGRGTRVIVNRESEPAPDFVWDDCLPLSPWYRGDRSALAAHRALVTIGTMLDPAATPFDTVGQVAKVMTLVAGVLSRLPGAIAVVNATTRTIYDAAQVRDMLDILGADELPVALWTRTLPIALADGDVSLATAGLLPFLGHEVEMWNAPLLLDEAGDQLSNVVRYLLTNGPTIGHGDTMGKTRDERSIRCFLGPSRADHDAPTQALFLEFADAGACAAPKPDLPEAPKPPMNAVGERVLRDFVANIGGRDATGVSDVIRGMLRDNEAVKDAARAVDAPPLDPKLAEADRLLRALKQDADGTSAEAIGAMQELLRSPPLPEEVARDDNPVFTNLMKMVNHEQATGALPTPEGTLPGGHVATLLLHVGVGLPVDELRDQLAQAFPERRWTVSASSRGLNEPRTVTGLGAGAPLVARIVAHPDACPERGAPPHVGHVVVSVSAPGPADPPHLAAVVLGCLVLGQDSRASGRLGPSEPWLDYDDLVTRMVAVKHQRRTPMPLAQQPQVAAALGRRPGGFGRKGL